MNAVANLVENLGKAKDPAVLKTIKEEVKRACPYFGYGPHNPPNEDDPKYAMVHTSLGCVRDGVPLFDQ